MMSSKALTFKHLTNNKILNIKYEDGICVTPDDLTKLLDDAKSYLWQSIKSTGNTLSHLLEPRRRHAKKNLVVDPKFLGIQSVASMKAVPVPGEVKQRGKKSSITPAMIEAAKVEAASGKTVKEAAVAMNIPYATLYITAKKHEIKFAAGVKGKPKKVLTNITE